MSASHPVRITEVRVDRRRDATLATVPDPQLGWLVDSDLPDWWQRSAELRFDDQVATLDTGESTFVDWPFRPLAPHESGELSVRVTGVDGSTSDWSEPVPIHAVFLDDGEWTAPTIALADPAEPAQPVYLRHEFTLEQPVTRAVLFATAEGVYQVSLNGRDVDDSVLKPGWTVYQERRVHESTDVTGLLSPGRNAIGVRLAGGWWTEEFGFAGEGKRFYGDQPAVSLFLRVEYADSTVDTVPTDAHWRATGDGPIRSSGLYQGETVDTRLAFPGWDSPGFDDASWHPVRSSPTTVIPEAARAEPVRRTQALPVVEVLTTPAGRTVLDFGQNLVGRLRLRVAGVPGQTITLHHAEVLEHGELALRPLRFAAATDTFVLTGEGEQTLEAEFTFHGFRYAQVDGWDDLDPSAVTAVVLGSDMRRTGWLETSDPLVDRLHENAVWGMRGNFLSLPTDCPQRDERLGWTGDAQVFAPSASFLYDSDAFLASWLRDVAVEQRLSAGVCPFIVPNVLGEWGAAAAAGWGDAATVVPATLFERFGDRRALADQFPSMTAWCDAVLALTGDDGLWRAPFQFGDWLDPAAPPDRPMDARTDPDLVANAYLVRSLDLTAEAARTLGDDAAEERYSALAAGTRAAFDREYLRDGDRLASDAPAAYALAIAFDLYDGRPERRAAFGDRLAALVADGGHRVPTGFLGTPVLLDALTVTGHVDDALRLLFQTENPSWLYQVLLGATTVWERWDSLLPDGTVNPGEMTSYNHYALGSIVDWMHRSLGGIAPASPGYRTLTIDPAGYTGFDRVRCAHETPYGVAEVEWTREDDEVTLTATVPANSRADVHLPFAESPVTVGSGTRTWTFSIAEA
ncbi:family 78 glycoside hydrolase catalytic domain [Leifsonia sp. NPDC058194]|uniref:alpha-L-rhamnosidase n=1 Tax=Leifsonia sp. NPDC058194 TaxID=3346374 RepID=UPI0036D82C5E